MSHVICHAPRTNLPQLTPSEEEYLEAIFTLRERKEAVKVKKLAKDLKVKDPSVVEMLRKLKAQGFVNYDRNGAKLTSKGEKYALKVVRRHDLAERLLTDVFGYPLPKVHEMACKFEHVLDDELTENIEKMLGNPKTCPHGSPIPKTAGTAQKTLQSPLTETEKGERCLILKIPEEREAVQRLLALNVTPGVEVKIIEKLPRGAIVLLCGNTKVALSHEIASQIKVSEGRGKQRQKIISRSTGAPSRVRHIRRGSPR